MDSNHPLLVILQPLLSVPPLGPEHVAHILEYELQGLMLNAWNFMPRKQKLKVVVCLVVVGS